MKILVILFVFISYSVAAVEELKCSRKGTQIYYLNDILKAPDEVITTTEKVRNILRKMHSSGKSNGVALVDKSGVDVSYLYNYSFKESLGDNALAKHFDLMELKAQRFAALGVEDPWKEVSKHTFKIILSGGLDGVMDTAKKFPGHWALLAPAVEAVSIGVFEVISDDVTEMMANQYKIYETHKNLHQDQINKFSEFTTDRMLEGKRVILVSHGQGSLFANEILTSASTKYPEFTRVNYNLLGSLNMGSFFTGSNYINSEYVTLDNDEAVKDIEEEYGLVSSPNYSLTQTWFTIKWADPFGDHAHDFDKFYLADNFTADMVPSSGNIKTMENIFLEKLNLIASRFPANCCQLADGTVLDEALVPHTNKNYFKDEWGEIHINESPGGLVSVNALADEFAYIDEKAVVCGNSIISNYVRVMGNTEVVNSTITSAFANEHIIAFTEGVYEPTLQIQDSTIKESTIRGISRLTKATILDSTLDDGLDHILAKVNLQRSGELEQSFFYGIDVNSSELVNGTNINGPVTIRRQSRLDNTYVTNTDLDYGPGRDFIIDQSKISNSDIGKTGEQHPLGEEFYTPYNELPYLLFKPNLPNMYINVGEMVNMRVFDSKVKARKIASTVKDATSFIKQSTVLQGSWEYNNDYVELNPITFEDQYQVNASFLFNGSTFKNGAKIGPGFSVMSSEIGYDVTMSSTKPNKGITNCKIGDGSSIISSFMQFSTLGTNVTVSNSSGVHESNLLSDSMINHSEIYYSTIGAGATITDSRISASNAFEIVVQNQTLKVCEAVLVHPSHEFQCRDIEDWELAQID